MADQPPAPSYQCPACHRWSVTPPVCAWCGAQLFPTAPAAPPRRSGVDQRVPAHWWVLGGGTAGGVVGAVIGAAFDRGDGSLGMLGFVGGFAAASYLALGLGRRLVAGAIARRARAYMARTRVQKISEVSDGFVRITGTVYPVQLATSPGGVECVAYERRTTEADGSVRLHAEGGVFEVDDGSGVRAVVRATHVGVPEGTEVGNEVVIKAGARVEIVGRARSRMATSENSVMGGLRSAARVVEIEGSSLEPLIVRQVAEASAPESIEPPATPERVEAAVEAGRVRVAVDSERAAAEGEGEEAEVERETRGARRGR